MKAMVLGLVRLGLAAAVFGCLGFTAVSAQAPQMSSLKPGTDRGALPLQGQDPAAPNAVDVYLVACLSALAGGHPAQAEQTCGQAIALDPQSASGYKLRGYVYLVEHRYERASEDFRVAIKIQPDNAENRAGYGQSFSGLGQFSRAVSEFTRAVALSPRTAAYHAGLCWARAGTGKTLQTALADCTFALALAPGTPGPLNSRALVKLRMGHLREAVADYDAALAVKPLQPSARFGRGLTKLIMGQKEAGIADIREARRADAEIDDLYILLGVLNRPCVQQPKVKGCPAGFPVRPERKSGYPWLVVALHSDPEQDYALTIEAGRLNLIVNQIALLLHKKDRGLQERPITTGVWQSEIAMLDQLSATAARFNALLRAGCATGKIQRRHCSPYHPSWANRVQADPTDALDEAYYRIGPVWAALCAGHKNSCRIE
jgi:tetratricopeptide (TPR) repeat protein